MRADLTRHGLEEARIPEDVDRILAPQRHCADCGKFDLWMRGRQGRSRSTASSTEMRVPRTTGFPVRIFGSMMIRSFKAIASAAVSIHADWWDVQMQVRRPDRGTLAPR